MVQSSSSSRGWGWVHLPIEGECNWKLPHKGLILYVVNVGGILTYRLNIEKKNSAGHPGATVPETFKALQRYRVQSSSFSQWESRSGLIPPLRPFDILVGYWLKRKYSFSKTTGHSLKIASSSKLVRPISCWVSWSHKAPQLKFVHCGQWSTAVTLHWGDLPPVQFSWHAAIYNI